MHRSRQSLSIGAIEVDSAAGDRPNSDRCMHHTTDKAIRQVCTEIEMKDERASEHAMRCVRRQPSFSFSDFNTTYDNDNSSMSSFHFKSACEME